MATLVADLRASLRREVNVPGFNQLPDITNTELDGYIADGFWELRLMGTLAGYTQTDGTEFATPAGPVIKTSDGGDLEPQFQMLVVMAAGLRLLRLKAMDLATSLAAKAGPVEYERQVSATVLRAILDALERRLALMRNQYSDFYGGAFVYFDGELQRERAMLDGLAELTVL